MGLERSPSLIYHSDLALPVLASHSRRLRRTEIIKFNSSIYGSVNLYGRGGRKLKDFKKEMEGPP